MQFLRRIALPFPGQGAVTLTYLADILLTFPWLIRPSLPEVSGIGIVQDQEVVSNI